MSESKCPKCLGRLAIAHGAFTSVDGYTAYGAACTECAWAASSLFERKSKPGEPSGLMVMACHDKVQHTAHFEPRPRLPTPGEVRAHNARHGDAAGLFCRLVGMSPFRDGGASTRWRRVHAMA